jgi:hypothetical protein
VFLRKVAQWNFGGEHLRMMNESCPYRENFVVATPLAALQAVKILLRLSLLLLTEQSGDKRYVKLYSQHGSTQLSCEDNLLSLFTVGIGL